jgi:hypothetical protein
VDSHLKRSETLTEGEGEARLMSPTSTFAPAPAAACPAAATPARSTGPRALVCLAAAFVLTLALLLGASGGARAATVTFGSSLSVPATLDTATGLGYPGYGIPTISEDRSIVFHVNHDAADTALWNATLASDSSTAPASGQVLSVSLEGCAQPAPGGPAPLTQIHFQDLTPQAGGGAQVNVTTQAFAIPVCGVGGADGSTVSTYQPTDFCVSQGDYVDFNDEGGWDPTDPLAYPSGVPYEVLGSVPGSTADSFIANNGTGNGATFSPTVTTERNGFAASLHEELLLQATLGTGPDALPLCSGGTKGKPAPGVAIPGSAGASWHGHIPTVTLPRQADGVNREGIVVVALYCHTATTCTGTLALHLHGGRSAVGNASFSVPSLHTGKVAVRLDSLAQRLVRHASGQLPVAVTLTPTSGAETHPLSASIDLLGWRAG